MVNKIYAVILMFSTFIFAAFGCQPKAEQVTPPTDSTSGSSTGTYAGETFEVTYSNGQLIYNNAAVDANAPTYMQDMTDINCMKNFWDVHNVTYTYQNEGYVRFTPSNGDPYLGLEDPWLMSTSMKYLLVEYRASRASEAEIYVNRSDGLYMGQSGTNVKWSITKSSDFQKAIVDISSVCKNGVKFTDFRIDPSTTGNMTVDIKYVATFRTKAAAQNFNFDEYKNGAKYNWSDPENKAKETVAEDYKESTVRIIDNKDGTATISYVKDGKKVSSVVPNDPQYTSGGYSFTDDLGRTLGDSSIDGIYGSNGEFHVGIFYFLWLGRSEEPEIFDINKIVQKYGTAASKLACGAYGKEWQFHFWGEPLYGYYFSSDEWVARKHMELLSNAGVDFLYFDITNGIAYIENAMKIMKVCHDMNESGYNAPEIVFYTNSSAEKMVEEVYHNIYEAEFCPDTWLYVDGKPVIIAPRYANIDDFFTIREPQWPSDAPNASASWPWMDFEWPQRVFANNGVGESISVSIAQHSGSRRFSTSALYGDTSNRGRSTTTVTENKSKVTADSYKYGYNFQAQWDRVFDCIRLSKTDATKKIKYVMVTGWNEWIAQRIPVSAFGDWYKTEGEEVCFVDAVTPEYSRDAEMTRGLYFDNYYLQLMINIQKLKGAAPVIIQDGRKPINVTGDFNQWDDVTVTYEDFEGDTEHRLWLGYSNTEYINQTGRNDIVEAKVINDTKNIYFYVKTAKDISKYDSTSSWMQLFVNTDGNDTNGWYGYDYIINNKAKDDFTTTVAKSKKNGVYSFQAIADISYRVKGNEMMIEVPLSVLGITDYENISIDFKWADSVVKITNMEGFYELGDCAPLGRPNWVFRNK